MRNDLDLDPEGRRLPIKVDSASNGEHMPLALTVAQERANALAQQRIDEAARKVGLDRRTFLVSSCGAAATLLAFNEAYAGFGARGGTFSVPPEAAFEPAAAEAALSGDELIIDLQTHCVDPSGKWTEGADGERWARVLTQVFGQSAKCASDSFDCYSAQQLVKEVFLDSDTDVAVISALWGGWNSNPTPMDYAAEAREIINTMDSPTRALIHGGVLPNQMGALDFMEVQAKEYKVSAWKLYPQWGPDGSGFFMDDERYGIPTLERARALGVPVVCAHRGLPLPFLAYEYSHPADIARAARLFPDLTFLCYHSGFEPGVSEGPYQPERNHGIDRLIHAYRDNGFAPNQGNLYAELGSVWRHYMSQPDQAAHVIGKLLAHFGEEHICWGTDSIWYGSPQDQIQAFRSFVITPEFQERYGYPPLTREAKAHMLGLNAARIHGINPADVQKAGRTDRVGRLRAACRLNPNPSFRTYGPKTRREFLDVLARRGGLPA